MTDADISLSIVDIYTAHIQSCLVNAKQGISGLGEDVHVFDGTAGVQTWHFFNNLLSMPDARYLEVGMAGNNGLELLCAGLMGNSATVLSFANTGLTDVSGRMALLDTYRGSNNVTVSTKRIDLVDFSRVPKMNVVGDANGALGVVGACLDDVFVYATGDWNDLEKQGRVRDMIGGLGWKIMWEKEIFTPGEGFPTWGNGVFVGVVSKV